MEQRRETHGDFGKVAAFTQQMKEHIRLNVPGWNRLNRVQREALDMIAVKIARIIHGATPCKDHWQDISGYAELAIRDLTLKD